MLHLFLGELCVLLVEAGAVFAAVSQAGDCGPCTAVVALSARWLQHGGACPAVHQSLESEQVDL